MKNKFVILIFIFFTACQSNWTSVSGNNSNLSNDKRYCSASADAAVPIYMCRNPLMCAPDEVGTVWTSIAQNDAAYDQCMISKGYQAQ